MPTDYNSKRDNSEGVDNKSKEKRYVNQPQHHGWEELAPEMKNFWLDFSTLAYEKTGRYPRFTSGKRTPKQKVGHAHETSMHNQGKAIDIAADYEMFNILYNTPDGLGLLNRYNLGVLDETSKAVMAKTGATGPHYHIGVDPALVSRASQRYNTYKETGNLQMIGLDRDITDTEFKIYAPATQQLEEDIAVEIEKEKKKEEKEEKSESRKKVSPNKEKSFFADIKLEQQKQEKYEPFQDTPQTKVQDILSDYSSISSDVQTKLPNIPNLFREVTTKDLDKMQDGGERNPKQNTQFKKGGSISKFQDAGVVYDEKGNVITDNVPEYGTIYVSDPNDPRIEKSRNEYIMYQKAKDYYTNYWNDQFTKSIEGHKDTIKKYEKKLEQIKSRAKTDPTYFKQAERDTKQYNELIERAKERIEEDKEYLANIDYRGKYKSYHYENFPDVDINNIDFIGKQTNKYGNSTHEIDFKIPDWYNPTWGSASRLDPGYYDLIKYGVENYGLLPQRVNRSEGTWIQPAYTYPSLTVRYADPEKYDWVKPSTISAEPEPVSNSPKLIERSKPVKTQLDRDYEATQPKKLTKQVTKSFYEQLPDGTYVKRTYTDVGKTDTFKFQDGGEIISSYGWDYKKDGEKYLTRKTGSENWIEATGEPLKAIKQKIYNEIPYTKEDKQSDYVNNVKQLIDKGYTLDNLVEKRIGTKEGLLNLFPELSSNKKEAEKSKEGEVRFKPSNRSFENKISNDILDVDTRLKFEINLDNIKERVKLDLKNRSSNLTQNETSEQYIPKREYEISPENLVEATRQFNENKFVVEDRFQPTKSQEESEKLTYRELSEEPSPKREYEISPENLVEATRQFNEEAKSVSKTSSSLEKIIEEDSFKNKVDKIKSNLSEEQKEAFSALVNSTKNAIFKYSKEIPILKDIVGDINITKNIPDYSRFVKSPTADIFREDIIEPEYKYGMSTDDLLREKGYLGKGIGNDPFVDCSGAVCKVMTSLGKDLGNPLNTNAQKIHDKTKEIKNSKDWKDGDIITFKTDSNKVDHVGFLVVDENSGEKFIAESSRSFQEGRIVPFEQRLDFLYDAYPDMKYYVRRFDK
jgi:hypothetical protein